MKRLAYVKCDNGFKRVIYLSQGKLGGTTEKQDVALEKELLRNGKYKILQITYLDGIPIDQIDEMIYIKKEEK